MITADWISKFLDINTFQIFRQCSSTRNWKGGARFREIANGNFQNSRKFAGKLCKNGLVRTPCENPMLGPPLLSHSSLDTQQFPHFRTWHGQENFCTPLSLNQQQKASANENKQQILAASSSNGIGMFRLVTVVKLSNG